MNVKRLALFLVLLFVVLSTRPILAATNLASSGAKVQVLSKLSIVNNLPYPGILPTNPFYFFKPIRDQILIWVTINPQDKAKLLLFLSQKRLATATALLSKNKDDKNVPDLLDQSDSLFKNAMGLYLSDTVSREAKLDAVIALRIRREALQNIFGLLPDKDRSKENKIVSETQKSSETLLNSIITPLLTTQKVPVPTLKPTTLNK